MSAMLLTACNCGENYHCDVDWEEYNKTHPGDYHVIYAKGDHGVYYDGNIWNRYLFKISKRGIKNKW